MSHEGPVKGGIDFETLNEESKSITWTRYGRSKLANVLFGKALARRLADTQVFVNIAHPGVVNTELTRHSSASFGGFVSRLVQIFTFLVAMKPATGALTQLYLATSPEIANRNIRGQYFVPTAHAIQPSPYGRDEKLQEKLWTFTETLVQEKRRVNNKEA